MRPANKGQLMKFRLSLAFALLAASAVMASSARAQQDAAELKKDMIGQWELSTTDRSKTCVVTLKPDSTPQGLKLELEPLGRRIALQRDDAGLAALGGGKLPLPDHVLLQGRGILRRCLRRKYEQRHQRCRSNA